MLKLPAYLVYLILNGAFGFFWWVIVTVELVYHVETVKLNPLQIVLVGTVLEAVYFTFEVPTGVVADVLSRRLSVIVGVILVGASFVLEGAIPLLVAVLLAQVIAGLGHSFMSGALEAWIAGEVGEEEAGRAFMRGSQVQRLCGLLGIPASVALASINLQLPIALGGGLIVLLGIFLFAAMPETGFAPRPRGERARWSVLWRTFSEGTTLVRRRPVLITILSVGIFYGMFSEGLDRLSIPHFLQTFGLPPLGDLDRVVWIGIIRAVAVILGAAVIELTRRRLATGDSLAVSRFLLSSNAVLVAGTAAFGLAGSFGLALAAYWLINAIRQANDPILLAWMNQHTRPETRATVFSMRGQVDSLGQIASGPAVGAIAAAGSLRLAFLAAAAVVTPVLAIYLRSAKRPAETL